MSVTVYVEGGDKKRKVQKQACREGFNKLFSKCFSKNPKVVACGGWGDALNKFLIKWRMRKKGEFVFLLIDSESPVVVGESPWKHLLARATNKRKPSDATDDNLLFMVTSMETWLVCDPSSLAKFIEGDFDTKVLPPLHNVESYEQKRVQNDLERAFAKCKSEYRKGAYSFKLLEYIDPQVVAKHSPSFARMRTILSQHL